MNLTVIGCHTILDRCSCINFSLVQYETNIYGNGEGLEDCVAPKFQMEHAYFENQDLKS